jgi:Tfp pilus assembly protein PilF
MIGNVTWRRSWCFCGALLICWNSCTRTSAADRERVESIGIVTADPANIMDGARVMTIVPKGTKLWVFNKERTWLEIKIPGTELHGWINRSNLRIVELSPEQKKRENELIGLLTKAFEIKNTGRVAEARAELARCVELMRPTYGDEPDIARVIHEVGAMDLQLGDFAAAKKNLDEAFAIRQKFLGDFNEQTGTTAVLLGQLAMSLNDYAAAKKHYDAALAAFKFAFGDTHPLTGEALNSLGTLALKQEDYPLAEQQFAAVLAIARKNEKPAGAGVARSLNNLGQTFSQQNKSAEAQKSFDEALQILVNIKATESSLAAMLHNNIGLLHTEQGHFAAAKQAFERSLVIQRKVLGKDNPELHLTLVNVADVLRKQSDFAASKVLLDEALALVLRTVGENDARTASVYNALGNQALQLGDLGGARVNFEKNLAIRRKLKDDSPANVVVALNNVGEAARNQGDYPTARKFLDESLTLARKTMGDSDPQVSTMLNNLGLLALEQGDYATAQKFCAESIALLRKTRNEDPELPQRLANLAELQRLQGNLEQGRKLLDEALVLGRKIYKQDNPVVANVLQAQASLAAVEGKPEQAQELFNQAIAMFRKSIGEDHPFTAAAISNLGDVYHSQNDLRQAWERYDEALAIRRRIYGQEHPHTVSSLEQLAMLAVREKEFDVAQKHWDEARRITRRYTQFLLPAFAPREQLQYLDERYLLGLLQSLSFGYLRREDATIANLSAGWLINGKAIAQESLAARELLARDLSDPQLAPLVTELQAARRKMATLSLAAVKREEQAAHQAELTAAAAAEYRLAQDLAQKTGTPPENRDWLELARFRRALRPEAVYVDLVRTRVQDFEKGVWSAPRYLAWIIPSHGQGAVQILDLGETQPIDDAIAAVRQDLQNNAAKDGALQRDGEALAQTETGKKLRTIADLVLQPLLPKLGSAKQLILSPDGALWLLPWAALPLDDRTLLLEKYTLQYVLSGREVLKLAAKSKNQPSAPAIFFNPNYDLSAAASKQAAQRLLPGVKFDEQKASSLGTRSSLPHAEALPNTALEGLAAAPLLRKIANIEPKAFQGDDALETVAKRLKRPRQLLFATHGFFLEDQATAARPCQRQAGTRHAQDRSPDRGESLASLWAAAGRLQCGTQRRFR